MPSIENPTVKRAAREVARFFNARMIAIMAVWTLGIGSVFTGILYENNNVVDFGIIDAIVYFLLFVTWESQAWRLFYLRDWLYHGVDQWTARGKYNPNFRHGYNSNAPRSTSTVLMAFGIPAALVFVSNFYFTPQERIRHKSGYVWVVDGNRTTGFHGSVWAIPYFQTIRWVSVNQTADFAAVATTVDGHRVRGLIHAELQLSADPQQIIRAANHPDPNAIIETAVEKAFTTRFTKAVSQVTLADLKPTLVLEENVGSVATNEFLRELSIAWNGTIAISDIHPYFGK